MINEKELPEGWRVTKLADFVNSKKGKKPKFVSTERTDEFNIPYVNIKAFEKNIIDEYTNGEGCVFCDEEDFLMVWDGSRSGYVGRAVKGAIGSTLVRLTFPKEVFEKYAYYFLQSKYIDINTKAKGVGIPHVDPNIVWNYEFLLPPVPEQHQIVEKIEELFSELDKGIENLKTAQQQLKVYRQAVLKWAFEGKLTNNNVKDGELPNGWEWKKLKEITKDISDGDHQPPPKTNVGIPFITISNVNKSNNVIDFDDTFKVSREYYHRLKDNRKPSKGDVLYTVTGSFGIPILVDFDKAFCFQRHIGLLRPMSSINQKWLYYLLQSPQVYNQAKATATGTAQKTVALNSLRNFEIPYAHKDEQLLIVQEIESRLSVCDKIEQTIIESLQQAEALRQSILKKAFEGKLVKADIQKEIANTVLINTNINDWRRKVLTGKIIFSFNKSGYVGRTKLQKILYLCENYAQVDFETEYIKEAAGPLDSKFLYSFLSEAKQKNWIEETHEGDWYKYEPGAAIGELTKDYSKYFRDKADKIQFILKNLHNRDTNDCELIATIYAIWNNYIIETKELNADDLVVEVYGWATGKDKFERATILSTWASMKKDGLVPVGFGKVIENKIV